MAIKSGVFKTIFNSLLGRRAKRDISSTYTLSLSVTLTHATGVYTFTVQRTGDTSGTTTVTYQIAASTLPGRTAALTSDFGGSFPSGTVTFNPGDTSKTFTLTPAASSNVSPE